MSTLHTQPECPPLGPGLSTVTRTGALISTIYGSRSIALAFGTITLALWDLAYRCALRADAVWLDRLPTTLSEIDDLRTDAAKALDQDLTEEIT